MSDAYDPSRVPLIDGWRLGAVALGVAALGDSTLGDVALDDMVPVAAEVVVIVAAKSSELLELGMSGTDTAAKGGFFGKTYVKGS